VPSLIPGLEAEGLTITPVTPRQVLKDAFRAGVIVDGQTWIDMLDHRNLLSHTYDSSVFEQAVVAIAERYLKAIRQVRTFLGETQAP
jgi:nucleotidyltransferase substrate binding protein (TIGR01987 family)